jgi:peptidoglycan/xylan/chitin deacetylase (PgdA/CDA1 family)
MRKILKRAAMFVLHRLGGARVLFTLHRVIKGRPVVTAITYHRIVDAARTARFYTDYDRGLDVGIFRDQIRTVCRYFECVTMSDFVDILSGRRTPTAHTALVTFDDADSEFATFALPVLQENRCRATIMVPTNLVESDRQLWHVRVSNLIMSATPEHWRALRLRADQWPGGVSAVVKEMELGGETERRAVCRAINRALDRVVDTEVEAMLTAWEALVVPERHLDVHCMTWDELRALNGVEVGIESHTANHLKLTLLDPDAVVGELAESKQTIEEKLGTPVLAVAYPQGYYDAGVAEAAHQTGYRAGFTTAKEPCRYPVGSPEIFQIPRMDVVGDTPQEVTLHLAKICLRSFRQN